MDDLEPDEQSLHRVLRAVRPEPLPVGFRDAVMRSVTARRGIAWEWVVAAALGLPSLAYLVWALVAHGADLAAGADRIFAAAQGFDETTGAAFFVDGLLVVAVALVGLGSLIAAHALLRTAQRPLSR